VEVARSGESMLISDVEVVLELPPYVKLVEEPGRVDAEAHYPV
jgi:hypothetical protein